MTTYQAPSDPLQTQANFISSQLANDTLSLNKPLNVLKANNLFKIYADFNQYQQIFDMPSYCKQIDTISINCESTADVALQVTPTALDNNSILTIPQKPFTGVSINDDVNVTLSSSSTTNEFTQIYNICKMIRTNLLNELSSQAVNGVLGDQITTSHTTMKHYMDTIITSFAYNAFHNVQQLINTNIDTIMPIDNTNKSTIQNIRTAAIVFGQSYGTNSLIIFNELVSNLQTIIDEIITGLKKDINDSKLVSVIQSLGNGNVYNSATYYAFRAGLIKALNKLTSSSCADAIKSIRATYGADVSNYYNKLIADIFIKCSYPLIQYQFISSILNAYMQNGDFVNTRIGLFSKIYFTYYITALLSLVLTSYKQSGAYNNVNSQDLSDITNMMNDIMGKLNSYLTNMNKINMKSIDSTPDVEISNIVDNLRTMSTDVQNNSSRINNIEGTIQDSRISIRNISSNLQIIDKKLKIVTIELILIIIIFFIITILSILLIAIKQEKYVFFIMGGTIALIILIKVSMLIFSFINKN
jgi:hypothetical protein